MNYIKKVFNIFTLCLTLIIFYYLFDQINTANIIRFSIKDNFISIILFFLLFCLSFYLLGLKYKIVISDYSKISVNQSIVANLIASTYNLILPNKAGDFMRHHFIFEKKINEKVLFVYNVRDKLYSFFSLIIISIIFNFFLIDKFYLSFFELNTIYLTYSIILIITFFTIFYFLLVMHKKKMSNILFPLDCFYWMLQFIQILLIFNLYNIDFEFVYLVSIFSISFIAGLLPITFGGFGAREGVLFFFSNILR